MFNLIVEGENYRYEQKISSGTSFSVSTQKDEITLNVTKNNLIDEILNTTWRNQITNIAKLIRETQVLAVASELCKKKQQANRGCKPAEKKNQSIKNPEALGIKPLSTILTEEQIKCLEADYLNNMKWKELREKYGISQGTCVNILRRLGVLGTRKRSKCLDYEMREKDIAEAYKSGMTINEIAKKYKISTYAIIKTIKSNGLRAPKRYIKEEVRKNIVEAYKNGATWREIREEFNITGTTLGRILDEYGVAKVKNPGRYRSMVDIIWNDKEKINAILRDYQDGVTWEVIQKKYKITRKTVLKIVERAEMQGIVIGQSRSQTKRKVHGKPRKYIYDAEKLKIMEEAYRAGKTYEEISEMSGINAKTIPSILRRNGIDLDRRTTFLKYKEEIRRLYLEEKKTITDISYIFGCARFRIKRCLENMGVEIRQEEQEYSVLCRVDLSEEHKKQILELREKNFKIREIAQKLGLSYEQVCYYLRRVRKNQTKMKLDACSTNTAE